MKSSAGGGDSATPPATRKAQLAQNIDTNDSPSSNGAPSTPEIGYSGSHLTPDSLNSSAGIIQILSTVSQSMRTRLTPVALAASANIVSNLEPSDPPVSDPLLSAAKAVSLEEELHWANKHHRLEQDLIRRTLEESKKYRRGVKRNADREQQAFKKRALRQIDCYKQAQREQARWDFESQRTEARLAAEVLHAKKTSLIRALNSKQNASPPLQAPKPASIPPINF